MSTSPVKIRLTADTRQIIKGLKAAKRSVRRLRFQLWLKRWFG